MESTHHFSGNRFKNKNPFVFFRHYFPTKKMLSRNGYLKKTSLVFLSIEKSTIQRGHVMGLLLVFFSVFPFVFCQNCAESQALRVSGGRHRQVNCRKNQPFLILVRLCPSFLKFHFIFNLLIRSQRIHGKVKSELNSEN